jgi:CheY-like chemotaxis protein
MSETSARIKILCFDDHPIVRQGIAWLLAAEPDMALVAEAANGLEAIQQFRAHRPDITLMDLQMPEMGGLDAIGSIRGEFPEARIIVLTTYAGDALGSRDAGRRQRLPAEERIAQGAARHHPRRARGAQGAGPGSVV